MGGNPFRIHGVVSRPDFTDREREVERMRRTLAEPGAKLLVCGERRMGKTSALRVAMGEHVAAGGLACLADFSTATSHTDLANRILDAATRALGRRWRDIVHDLSRRIGVNLDIGLDPVTQAPTASLGLGVREGTAEAQRETLARVLDSLEAMCEQREISLGMVLDEFQEINRFGGEEAEWHLRGILQHHRCLSYVVAGSRTHLIQRMTDRGGAFYKLFDVLSFGPMDAEHLARWIDERLAEAGVTGADAGTEIVRLAGPRTRDVVQLARKAFDVARDTPTLGRETVNRAFVEVVQDESDPLRALWNGYSEAQKRVLRAVAAGTDGLTADRTLRRFSLKSSAAASRATGRLIELGVLEQAGPGDYRFDSPFQRGWVVINALPDVGIHLPPTHTGT